MNQSKEYYNIPKSFFEENLEQDRLALMYYYFRLRNIYKANVFFKQSTASIAKLIGVKKSSLYHYLRQMAQLGWVYYNHRGDLCLKGINSLKKDKYELCYKVPIKETKAEQVAAFRLVSCVDNLRMQTRIMAKKAELTHSYRNNLPISGKLIKFMRKMEINPNKDLQPTEKRLNLSNAKIGCLNYRSQSTGRRIQKKWNELGLVTSAQNIKVLQKNVDYMTYMYSLKYANKDKVFYSYADKGVIFSQGPNFLSVNDTFYDNNIKIHRGSKNTLKENTITNTAKDLEVVVGEGYPN